MHIQTPFRDQKWHGVPTSLQSQLSRAAALSPLMLAAAVAPTPRCSMQQHISRLSFTMALWLIDYPHLLFGIIYGFYLYMCIYIYIYVYIYTDRYLSISINININISIYLSIYIYYIWIGGASRLVKDYTPLINRISPFIFGLKWMLYGL
jgi:hypothetical protein